MGFQIIIDEMFSGSIWRMEIDELTETIVLELRNNEDRKVSFGSMSLKNGECNFKGLTIPERWLTGIEVVYDGVLLLHYYQSETGPAHKGLLAIDAFTSKTLWSNYNYTFDHLSINGPVVFDVRVQPRKLFIIDFKTGATTNIYEPSLDKLLLNNIVLPDIVTQEKLPSQLIPEHLVGNLIHYLEYNNLRIVSLHASKGGQLTQSVFIFDGVEKVYEDLLNDDIQKIQPEAFILHKNSLIYIKNKTELKVLSL